MCVLCALCVTPVLWALCGVVFSPRLSIGVVLCILCGLLFVLWEFCGVFMWLTSGNFVVLCVGQLCFVCEVILSRCVDCVI